MPGFCAIATGTDSANGCGTGNGATFTALIGTGPGVLSTNSSLPTAVIGVNYLTSGSQPVVLSAGDGSPPYSWALTAGSLPLGLSLNTNGTIAGTTAAQQTGSVTFTVRVTDNSGATASQALTIMVANWPQSGTQPLTEYIRVGSRIIAVEQGGRPSDLITAPSSPFGPTQVTPSSSYTYSTGGASAVSGEAVQYMFQWGDGTNSGWLPTGSATASHGWSTGGRFDVVAQARSSLNPVIVSAVSPPLAVASGTETISPPNTPSGTVSGNVDTTYSYTTGGAGSSFGNPVQYQFVWADGTTSGWLPAGTAQATHVWGAAGSYAVYSVARSARNPAAISGNSATLGVSIGRGGETVSTPDTPEGVTSALPNTTYNFTVSGAVSTYGNAVQYQFSWGDGSVSGWLPSGTTTASHAWSALQTFSVTAQARSVGSTTIFSGTSSPLSVSVSDSVPVSLEFIPTGSAASQTFTLQVLDYGGANSVTYVQGFLSTSNTSLAVQNGCHFQYQAAGGGLLALDRIQGDDQWVGSQVTGQTWTGSNSNGICQVTSWSASTSGTFLTLTVALQFKTAGTWWEWMSATNAIGNSLWATNNLSWVVPAETVSTPSVTGPQSGGPGSSYQYTASGAASSYANAVQYQFNWGDGGPASGWLSSGTATHSWGGAGTYNVTVQARSATNTTIVSSSSSALAVAIASETVSQPNVPSGSSSGVAGTSYQFTTGGSASSFNSGVEYQFSWGDATSGQWLFPGTTSDSHTWNAVGTFNVTAQARSAGNTSITSSASNALAVAIADTVPIASEIVPAGSGGSAQFTVQVRDYAGASAVQNLQLLLSPTQNLSSIAGSCHLFYNALASPATLSVDSSAGGYSWVGTATVSSPNTWTGTNSNGICQVGSWSIVQSGEYLSLIVNLTFQTSGTWWEFLAAQNATGVAGWIGNNATWTSP